MALVPAKCTNCNGELQIDNTKDAAVCPYCGSAFVIEKAIQLYSQTYNIKAETVNIYQQGGGRDNADKLFDAGMRAFEAENYKLAEQCFKDIKKNYPSDYRGPFGLMKCVGYGYSVSGEVIKIVKEEYENANTLANSEQKDEVIVTYNQIINNLNMQMEELVQNSNNQRSEKIKNQTNKAHKELKKLYSELCMGIMVSALFCIPFIVSFIIDTSTILRVIFGILFFGGIIGFLAILSGECPKIKEARIHFERCQSGQYQKDLENNW